MVNSSRNQGTPQSLDEEGKSLSSKIPPVIRSHGMSDSTIEAQLQLHTAILKVSETDEEDTFKDDDENEDD